MSGNSIERGKMRDKIKKKPLLLGVGITVGVIVVALVAFFVLRAMNVVATPALRVGDTEVSQTDFDEYVRLGAKDDLTKSEVRELVVEYEKNRLMAERFDVEIPAEYVKYAKNEHNAADVGIQVREKGDPRDSLLTKAQDYNRIFDSRVAQMNQSGYGIFVYEFGIPGGLSESTLDARSEQAKSDASKYKSRIADNKESPANVLEDTIRYNAQEGQTVHSGFYFVPDMEYPGMTESDKYVQSPPYLLSILKDASADPIEVRQTDGNSYFFMYELFEQKGRDDVAEEIASTKEGIRVVIYDR